ncbi:CD209 antigen-like protein E [Labeo rohita]|uniref:CD209 antigen-like protein E n=1 Tax=Labeo rohita TaxID=84645 RepID=UPI0021E2F838|nr:CD209 antigen-like protein E [Labeo rohita]
MESDIYYVSFENRDIEGRTLPQTPCQSQDAGKAKKGRGCGCLVLMATAVCFVLLICGLLLVFVTLQHISITAEKHLFKTYKDTVQVFNQTNNRLHDTYSDLMTENDQLQEQFNDLSDELKRVYKKGSLSGWFFITDVSKSWSESRQYCRNQGADLVMIKTEEKQRFITSIISGNERVWIGLSDTYREGKMYWVESSPLKQGYWQKDQPNDEGLNEDCVELVSAFPALNNWNDAQCTNTQKAICEKSFI